MITNIFFAILTFLFIGLLIFTFIEPRNRRINVHRFLLSYIVGLLGCSIFFFSFDLLGLPFHRNVYGLFAVDSSSYYLQSVNLLNNNFSNLQEIVTDHYHQLFLAINLYIFGENVWIPKIYQVFLFSISVVLWTSIARDIYEDKRFVKYFFYFLVTCVPLLTYTAIVLKEISLFFATSVATYAVCKLFNFRFSYKYLLIAFIGIVLMFLFRRQFALLYVISFSSVALLSSRIQMSKKVFVTSLLIVVYFSLTAIPFFSKIDPLKPLLSKGQVFIARGEKGRIAADTPLRRYGIIGSAFYIATNPITIAPMLSYGTLMLFFHPSFLQMPEQMMHRDSSRGGSLDYLTMGYYNILFLLLFPSLVFGVFYFYRSSINKDFHRFIILYFVFAGIAIIFASDSHRRFKISYFWPIVYLYIVYGISVYYKWKKHMPIIFLFYIFLFVLYLNKNFLINIVSL